MDLMLSPPGGGRMSLIVFLTDQYSFSFFFAQEERSIGFWALRCHVYFLSLRKSKDLWEWGVELYDSDGKFLKYAKLGDSLSYDIRCRDSNDRFYAIQRKEFHKVVIFRLRY
jgi:hypothetical protein